VQSVSGQNAGFRTIGEGGGEIERKYALADGRT
jgi:hypothetical protein